MLWPRSSPSAASHHTYSSMERALDSVPFCVVENPFVIWGDDIAGDNRHFLERVDAELYYRTAHNIIGGSRRTDDGNAEGTTEEEESDQDRKDVSSLSRLLWHHGVETLVMMLGAYIQAPGAVHGYFLKCRTEDAIELGRLMLRGTAPKYNRLTGAPFSVDSLLSGVHRCANWTDHEQLVRHFATVLGNMLRDYVDQNHRWEYNSIKHGLRASHGRFAIAIGVQEAPGIPAPPEAMEVIGGSRDASFFDVAKPIKNASKRESRMHFVTEKVSVAWSLERVLCELQIISMLIHNVVSALRIVAGAGPGTVTFNRVSTAEDEAFWATYLGLPRANVPTASMSIELDAEGVSLPTEKQVFASYARGGAGRA
jgi:hypothetical protein